jgi:hypothetical protein
VDHGWLFGPFAKRARGLSEYGRSILWSVDQSMALVPIVVLVLIGIGPRHKIPSRDSFFAKFILI